MCFRVTSPRGVIKVQVTPNGQAFVAGKDASLPESKVPEQPLGFPVSGAIDI